MWVGYPDEFKPMKTEFQGAAGRGRHVPRRDLEDLHGVAAEVRPAAQEGRRRRHRQGPRADADAQGDGQRDAPARRRRRAATAAPPATGGGTAAPADTATQPSDRRRPADAAADTYPAPASGRPPHRPPAPTGRRHRAGPAGHGDARTADGPRAADERLDAASARAQAGGQGRETSREPSAQKRHGSSAALVIPIRGPVTTRRHRPTARAIPIGPSIRTCRVSVSSIPSAWVELARAVGTARRRRPRRARMSSTPRSGSSARISTAAPTPSGSQTAFSSAWMP